MCTILSALFVPCDCFFLPLPLEAHAWELGPYTVGLSKLVMAFLLNTHGVTGVV